MRATLSAVLAIAFASVLASAVAALPLETEAGFFVASGETLSIANFTSGGSQYSMLKINGDASVVFHPTADGYAAVTDNALLSTLVPDYLKTQPLPFDASVLASVRTNYNLVNDNVGGCVKGVNAFYSCRTPPPFACAYMWISVLPDYPQALDEVRKLDVAFPGLSQGVADLNSSMDSLQAGFDANELDRISAAAGTMFNAVSAIQTSYNTVVTTYSVIKPMFPYAFSYWDPVQSKSINADCSSTTALSTALNSLSSFASSTKALSTSDTLNRVETVTASRNASAAAKKIHYFRSQAFQPTSDAARKTLSDFGAAGLIVTGLNNEFTQVTSLLDSIRNATTAADAQAKAAQFDSAASALKEKVALYAALAPEYNASVVAKANASAQISKAAKRFGANSNVVLPLQKQYAATTNTLKSIQDKLSSGQAVSPADLRAVTANYTRISLAASGESAPQGQVDLVVVGGVVAVIVAVAAVVVYLRKFRGKKGKEPLDVRKLAPAQKPAAQGPIIQGPPWLKR